MNRDDIARRIKLIERQCENIAMRLKRERRNATRQARKPVSPRPRKPDARWPADLPRYPGVALEPRNGKRFVAYAKEGWRQYRIGLYDSYEEAVAARKAWTNGRNDGG